MGILSRLFRAGAAGISTGMSRSTLVALLGLGALALAASGCDVRPLTSRELYGASGGTGGAGTGGGGGGVGGQSFDGGGVAGTTPDAGAEAPAADAVPEAPASACPAPCAADQFCDELTGQCAPRSGVGMLSGIVVDQCSGDSVDALIGIAGHHACAYLGKGAYFFTGLPLGKLKLAAAKEGYELYGATVDIVPGGVIHDVHLMRVGGCTAMSPVADATWLNTMNEPELRGAASN